MDEISDAIDYNIKEQEVTCCNIFWISVSIILFIVDFGLDITLAVKFFYEGNTLFFAMILVVMIVPALILTKFSIWWYKDDAERNTFKVPDTLRRVRQLLIILLMAPLLRDFEALYYGIKSIKSSNCKEKKQYYCRMKTFVTDAAILKVLEAYMECGPQVILQLYIFAETQASKPNVFTVTDVIQMTGICFSLISMSAAYASYQYSLRFVLHDKGKLNLPRTVFIFFWKFFDVASRVIALGLFASVFPYYLLLTCFAHFIAMFCWIRTMKTTFYENNRLREFIYNLVLAAVFVFFYLNPKDGPTRQRYTVYYILMFLENTALICVWFYFYSPDVDLRFPFLIVQFMSFVMAVILMVIYYYFVHPTRGKIKQISKMTKEEPEIEMRNCEIPANPGENENMIAEVPAC